MFGTILITFVITALGMTVVFQHYVRKEQQRAYNRLTSEKENLEREITDRKNRDTKRRAQDAYNQGLYDGRETDAIYRQVLSRQASGERMTIMMNGNPERK